MSSNREKQMDSLPVASPIQQPLVIQSPVAVQRVNGIDFDSREVLKSAGPFQPNPRVIMLHIAAGLLLKKVYFYAFAQPNSAAVCRLEGKFLFTRDNTQIGVLPWSIVNQGQTSGQSGFAMGSVFSYSGEAWLFSPTNQLTGESGYAYLAPMSVILDCDRIVLSLDTISSDVTGYRLFMAVTASPNY